MGGRWRSAQAKYHYIQESVCEVFDSYDLPLPTVTSLVQATARKTHSIRLLTVSNLEQSTI